MTRLRVAAVQPAVMVGDVLGNLERLERLIRDAHREHHPSLIVLPEAMTSSNLYHPALRNVPRPVDGPAFQMLTRLARELECAISGGSLSVRGRDVYGTYVLAEPDGRAHLHDKDQPTATEAFDYRGGDDDGVTQFHMLGDLPVGLVSGWEWARTRTARRFQEGRVRLAVGGMCWPYMPTNWRGPLAPWMRAEQARGHEQCRNLPGLFAQIVGVPTVYASLVGDCTMYVPGVPGVRWRTVMFGETQICSADGTVLARLSLADGESHIGADVELGEPRPTRPLPSDYWVYDLHPLMRSVFHVFNKIGFAHYTARKLRRRNFHSWPAADLPDELGPMPTGQAHHATSGRRSPVAPLNRNEHPDRAFWTMVDAREEVADGVVSLTLRHPLGKELPAWRPGAHVDLLLPGGLVRQYSLCGDPDDRSSYTVAVLRATDSRGGSEYVHEALRPGVAVRLRGPRNNFELVPAKSYLFVAGGIGITPIVPMLARLEAQCADWSLIYGGRHRRSMAFADELRARYGNRVELVPEDERGVLDVAAIAGSVSESDAVYCCGPEMLLQAMETALGATALEQLHVERFTARPSTAPRTAFSVSLARSGLELEVPAHRSLLDVVEDAGVVVDSSCRDGICGTCRVGVISGEPDHRDSVLSLQERAAGDCLLICVSRGISKSLVLDL
ncbi:hypothetical protein GCM10009547_43320 [Sporichthya brevicatena]|uniref:Uncharacterized protein n=1 Tax=Sporichthya brevicatena TaxID=171442 RepID=A0ABP3SJB3_9ACTN